MDQDLLSLFPSETPPPVRREQSRAKPVSSSTAAKPRVRPPVDKMHALDQSVQFLKARSHAHSEGYRDGRFVSADEALPRDVPVGRGNVSPTLMLVGALIATTVLALAGGRFLPAVDRPSATQAAVPPPVATPTKNLEESTVAEPSSPPEVRTEIANATVEPVVAQRTTPPEGDRPTQAIPTTPPPKMIYKGDFVVDSVPAGATVLINQRPAGTTPLHLEDYPAGSYAVWVELEGYERWTAAIRVQANRTTNIRPLLSSTPTRQSDTE